MRPDRRALLAYELGRDSPSKKDRLGLRPRRRSEERCEAPAESQTAYSHFSTCADTVPSTTPPAEVRREPRNRHRRWAPPSSSGVARRAFRFGMGPMTGDAERKVAWGRRARPDEETATSAATTLRSWPTLAAAEGVSRKEPRSGSGRVGATARRRGLQRVTGRHATRRWWRHREPSPRNLDAIGA